jgi:hypothetical protein
MAERNTVKAKRPETAKGPAKAGVENARLKAELAEARERIADLELKQAEMINRIDWVIDSLHNLPE